MIMTQSSISTYLESIFADTSLLFPEFVLCIGAFSLLIVELIYPRQKATTKIVISSLCLLFSAVAVFAVSFDGFFFNNGLYQNALIQFLKVFLLIATLFVLLFPRDGMSNRGEYYFLLLMILVGAFMVMQAQNLLIFYLSFELISIASFVLTTFRFNKKGFEAGIKYLLFGALSSGLMLYGISLLYGLSGSFDLAGLADMSSIPNAQYWQTLGISLFLVGILFKLSLIPFHIWTPDTYQAAPAAIVAFFSIVPKTAVFIFLFQFSTLVLAQSWELWELILSIIAIMSIFLGNLSAIRQTNAQRMMGYSTIAHSGTLLIAIILHNELGLHLLVFYLVVYAAMNLGGLYLIRLFQRGGIYSMASLSRIKVTQPIVVAATVMVMIGLTGLPPTGGFMAKFLVFAGLWERYAATASPHLLWLFIFGLANAVIALFYYLKIPYFLLVKKDESTTLLEIGWKDKIVLAMITLFILITFFKAGFLLDMIYQFI